mgnify:CR=1 FL=1
MWELEQQVEELVNKYLEESGAVLVSADKLGLDRRSGSIYVLLDEDCIAVKGSVGSLNYYGGFEYIKDEYKTTIGHVTFYSAETSRVEDALEYYEESLKQNKEGEVA